MSISSHVVILTQDELIAYHNEWFQKGVERGRFEEGMDQSRAKATEGKAGNAEGQPLVRQTTTGTGLRVGEASAVLPATSEFMDVTSGRDRNLSDPTADRREIVARIINPTAWAITPEVYGLKSQDQLETQTQVGVERRLALEKADAIIAALDGGAGA